VYEKSDVRSIWKTLGLSRRCRNDRSEVAPSILRSSATRHSHHSVRPSAVSFQMVSADFGLPGIGAASEEQPGSEFVPRLMPAYHVHLNL
jgi:hypothetical protein